MTPFMLPTWADLEAATPEEQILWGTLFLRWARNNYEEKIRRDTEFDHDRERSAYVDEHTELGGDAERIRQAGKLTTVRNSHSKATKG